MIKTPYNLLPVLLIALLHSNTYADQQSILVQSTTSTANSGLYDYLLPHFEEETGNKVNVVAVGTGQAIKNASNCDADVLLVHAKSAEEDFVRDGYGVERHNLMYNDFVLIGPADDPAQIQLQPDATAALRTIAEKRSIFASRGDNSGTHKKEIQLWQQSGTDPTIDSGKWYRETGSGMGATLNIAVGMGAYTMTDRATWINFKNPGDHKILLEGDERLFNQYGIILVNNEKCPHSNATTGAQFINWMTGEKGQSLIASYKLKDQQLFFPNADRPVINGQSNSDQLNTE